MKEKNGKLQVEQVLHENIHLHIQEVSWTFQMGNVLYENIQLESAAVCTNEQ